MDIVGPVWSLCIPKQNVFANNILEGTLLPCVQCFPHNSVARKDCRCQWSAKPQIMSNNIFPHSTSVFIVLTFYSICARKLWSARGLSEPYEIRILMVWLCPYPNSSLLHETRGGQSCRITQHGHYFLKQSNTGRWQLLTVVSSTDFS